MIDKCLLDWNEDSLRRHIRSVHAEDAISEPAIQLLWRSFHYYAYHPFPRTATEGRIDCNAFQRAILLLPFQGNDLLGTQESDYFWRHDDDFFRRASFERLFRSIGRPMVSSEKSPPSDHDSAAMVSDIMDVLSMTQPQPGLPNFPSPLLLEPAAWKFVGDPRWQYQVTRQDCSILLSLLIRLRLRKARWGSALHFGSIDSAETGDEAFADVLVNGLGTGQDVLTSAEILKAVNLLVSPNLKRTLGALPVAPVQN